MTDQIFYQSRIDSPVGEIIIVTDEDERLRSLDFSDYADRAIRLLERQYGAPGEHYVLISASLPKKIKAAFAAYFDGALTALEGLAVKTRGTAFQEQVWSALRTIPAGGTVSYGDIANQIGNASAVRAVGAANGANPVGIVVPCHRVIGADGSLTGFGGGIERKRWLLTHEGALSGALL
jgi:methylated-DNA-[protein]-cysteine S-methyltransferase